MTEGEVGEDRRAGIFAGPDFVEAVAPRLDAFVVLLPGELDEGHHRAADVGRRDPRVRRHRDRVEAALPPVDRLPRMQLDPRLGEVGGVVLGDAGLERLEDHLGGGVEALARLRHRHAERLVLLFRQAAPEAEHEAVAHQDLRHRDLLRDAGRVGPPGEDDRAGADRDPLGPRGQVTAPLEVVGHHRVAGVEVVLRRLDEVHPHLLGEDRDVGLAAEHLRVGHVLMRVLEDELQAAFH